MRGASSCGISSASAAIAARPMAADAEEGGPPAEVLAHEGRDRHARDVGDRQAQEHQGDRAGLALRRHQPGATTAPTPKNAPCGRPLRKRAGEQPVRSRGRGRTARCRRRTAPSGRSGPLRRDIRAVTAASSGAPMTTPSAYAETRWPAVGHRDAQVVGDVGQQAHHHEFGGADTEGADGESEQGQGHERPFKSGAEGDPCDVVCSLRNKVSQARLFPSTVRGEGSLSDLPIEQFSDVATVTRATGRWSLPVCRQRPGARPAPRPCTMIWSMRAIGNDAGQLKPKPSPAAPCVERIWEVTALSARSFMVPFRSPSSTTFVQRLVGDGLAQRVGALVALAGGEARPPASPARTAGGRRTPRPARPARSRWRASRASSPA